MGSTVGWKEGNNGKKIEKGESQGEEGERGKERGMGTGKRMGKGTGGVAGRGRERVGKFYC